MKFKKFTRLVLLRLEGRTWFMAAAIIFRFALEASYITFVNPLFEYSGFSFEPSILKYIESWVILVGLLFTIDSRLKKPSDYLMAYIVFAFLTPLLIFYAFTDATRTHLYMVVLCTVLVNIFRRGKRMNLPLIPSSRPIGLFILVSGVIIVTFWMIVSGGLQFFNTDLTQVYDFRDLASDVINQGPMAYLNIWATKVFGPSLLAYYLWKRRYLMAAIIFLLHFIWFAISSHKSVLFYPFLVTFLWVWFERSKALALVPLGMTLAVFYSTCFYLLFDDILPVSLFVRRVFFVPAHLTFVYYDFFSQNQFVYWSSSITSLFIKNPYEVNTALVIGHYLGTESRANNSFMSIGYMHAGLLGVIIYGLIAGLIFRLVDAVSSQGVPLWFSVAVMIVPSQALILSSDLPTALLTHGFGAALMILYLMRSKNNKD